MVNIALVLRYRGAEKSRVRRFGKHSQTTKSPRSRRGNTLVLTVAVIIGIVVPLLFFCLNYARLLGSNAEQKKAIESAALAAATDVSSIVVNTSEFGYVSLSDQAPIGKATAAGDLYYLPVRGINTIIGTARVDAIIADKMPNSGIMSTLALNDLNSAKSVINKLSTVITASLTAAGSPQALDRDGNKVNVYLDAENAYKQNVIRMSGSASYVPNSLVLTLGSLSSPGETNIPVPTPTSTAPVPAAQQAAGCYRSFVNITLQDDQLRFWRHRQLSAIGCRPRLCHDCSRIGLPGADDRQSRS